jgi:light-regulated signal transduction histidine kinase (bacteriophytochrome)
MGHLIDDLLTFSRLSRQPLKKQPVGPARIVNECLVELQAERQGRSVEIRIGELPECQADPALLKQVWINLLSNALKYTGKREAAVIEIGSLIGGRERAATYFVKDNGVGFDMKYANKLFGVFQRLHRAEDFAGTGVGLAIVQRIIHRHGGRIWPDARPGSGAAFYFTLEGAAPDEREPH